MFIVNNCNKFRGFDVKKRASWGTAEHLKGGRKLSLYTNYTFSCTEKHGKFS